MNSPSNPDQWYALQVRARWENSTATLLSGKGYRTLLPTFTAKGARNGRSREVTAPLFSGYVFCQFDAINRLPILVTPGVIAVVGRGRIPIPVEDYEIQAIQKVVFTGLPVEPWPYLEVGQQVRIERGALCGVEGILTGFKGVSRIVLSVSLLRRSVALEIDRFQVSAMHPVRTAVVQPLPISPLLEPAVA